MRGVGLTHFEWRDYVAAIDLLESALVDGRRVTLVEGGVIRVHPGEHAFHAEAPGQEPPTGALTTDGGERLTLSLELRPPQPPPPAVVLSLSVPVSVGTLVRTLVLTLLHDSVSVTLDEARR